MNKKLLLILGIFLSFTFGFSQKIISVHFSNGFFVTYAGSNSSPVAYHLSSLGIHNVRFTQSSTSGQFMGATQGNDIPGNVILIDNSGVQYTIPGVINWRAPSGTVTTMVFLPADNTNIVVATNGANGSSNYTIKGAPASPYTAIGLTFNGSTLSFTDGGTVNGNAATSGLLSALNTYLGSLPSLSINNVSVTEGPGTTYAILTVTLSVASTDTVTVDYVTANNTAVSGTNYVTTSGTLTFPPGTTTKTISIPVVDNSQPDNGNTFYVNLSNPTNASIIGLTGTVTINDTDAGNPLATTEQSSQMTFALKQNPVQNGVAQVEYHNVKDATVEIFDTTGKNIKKVKLSNTNGSESIDVSGLAKGMYFLILKSQSQAAVTKMIIK
jgi:hypothetical protein